MESGKPYRDNHNLRTPLHQLNEVLSVVIADYWENKRHGNATNEATDLAIMATKSQGEIQQTLKKTLLQD